MRRRRRKIQISPSQIANSRLKMRFKEFKIILIKKISKDMVKNKIKI
jgi:precorrin-6B methylase 1